VQPNAASQRPERAACASQQHNNINYAAEISKAETKNDSSSFLQKRTKKLSRTNRVTGQRAAIIKSFCFFLKN
jgi:hypothetical protein